MINVNLAQLRDAVANSTTWTNVCRVLNIENSDSSIYTLRYLCNKNDINFSHFMYINTTNMDDYYSGKIKPSSNCLKMLLIERLIKEPKCECCGITEWQGNPAPLELHHKNGNGEDNSLENLQIVCCNCHALTHNYRAKNKKYKDKKSIKDEDVIELIQESYTKREVILKAKMNGFKLSYPKIDRVLRETGTSLLTKSNDSEQNKIKNEINEIRTHFSENGESYIAKNNSNWNNEPKFSQRRVVRPTKEQLETLIKEKSIRKIGEQFGVTDNSIRKWCRYYLIQLPDYPIGYWRRREIGMSHDEALNPPAKPEKVKKRQLSINDVAIIKRRLLNNEGIKKLSEEYKISYECIRDIKYGRTYITVQPANN